MSTCPLCRRVIVPPSGPAKSKILLVGEFPGYKELQMGRPWCGEAGMVLQRELGRVGIPFSTCRSANLWQHEPTKDKAYKAQEYEWHFGELLKELKKVKAVLMMGSELAPIFFGHTVSQINGCLVTSPLLPKNIEVAVASYNPAICLQRDGVVGDFRFAVQYFAELTEEIRNGSK